MQQVAAKAMTAGAVAVNPRRLPVPHRRPANRALVNVRHAWVLHKRLIVRGFAAILVCLAVIGAYEARQTLGAGAVALSDMLQGEFADAGFAVAAIEISGQALTSERDIVKALGIAPKTSTLNFDAEAARARLEDLPAVSEATIRKIYPGRVVVSLVEKSPVARWRVDGVTFLVDATGAQIGEDLGAFAELPLVVGDGAADDALVMIRAMERFDILTEDLAALSRIADRRWDLIYSTGLRVQLPELGVAQALVQLEKYQQQYALLDRDVTLIDLRVPGMVAVKPAMHDEETETP